MSPLHLKQKKPISKRAVALLLSLCILTMATVGGTYAWMHHVTGSKVNTFKGTDINISFSGASGTQRMVPGEYISVPDVTVQANSLQSYLFVRVLASNNASRDKYLTFTPMSSTYTFTQYADNTPTLNDLYFYTTTPATSASAAQYNAFANGRITINVNNVTKEELASVDDFTLNIQYCAVQKENLTVDQAFALCSWS